MIFLYTIGDNIRRVYIIQALSPGRKKKESF